MIYALAIMCTSFSSAAGAADQFCTPDFPRERLTLRVSDANLAKVRGGAVTPDVPPQQVSVILWDERSLPTPPVRNMQVDTRITAEMNVLAR